MAQSGRAERYRFGVFEADGASGELRRQGIRIRLNVQPFQVLLLLLERAGEVLTREEIARELWPEGTFVDYEHGVNSAVNRIREALGDSARNPRFLETLARRGYRFVAPVERLTESRQAPPADPAPASPAKDPEGLAEAEERYSSLLTRPEELPASSHRTVNSLFVLLQMMYLGFYVGALANLAELEELFAALPRATEAVVVLIVTAALLIPVRIFLISATLFHPPRVRQKLLALWPYLVPFDLLWALAPLLLLHHMNLGLAIACVAPLVYAPFAERSLVLMGAGERRLERM